MLDYAALRALAAIVHTGSFDKAARQLGVTPSAISQRVKQLEERLGAVLIVRGQPCMATETGDRLCRHMELVGMLEGELFARTPALKAEAQQERTTVHVAGNADSLGTWFVAAINDYARRSNCLVNVAIDDQAHTAEWLEKGRVSAAVTSLDRQVTGCRSSALGSLRYRATASPEFVASHFAAGIDISTLAAAPALMFNQKDRLQERWMESVVGCAVPHPFHCLPSTHAFVDAALAGIGWGMNPEMLVADHLKAGKLVELAPNTPIDVALSWQVARLSADVLAPLTRHVERAARALLAR